jgi:type IV pilus assembly protein PilM
MFESLRHWLSDPPPATIFEVGETGVTLARLAPKSRLPEKLLFCPLAEGAVEASPLRQNIHDSVGFETVLKQLLEQAGPNRKKEAALLLPDNCARVAVLEFDNLPADSAERLSLIRWRLKKAVPFDADTASISFHVQRAGTTAGPGSKQFSVLVAVSPVEVITQYEGAVRKLGLMPGYVGISVAAALNLLVEQGVTMLVKRSGRILSVVLVDQGQVRLVRALDEGTSGDALTEDKLREIAADLYPTFVYVADNFGSPVSKLVLAGFGSSFQLAADVFRRELGYESEPLKGPQGFVDAHSAGIWGYLSAS